MGNIVYKVAPKHMIDNLIFDLKGIIKEQQLELESLRRQTVLMTKSDPEDIVPDTSEGFRCSYYDPPIQMGDVLEITFLPGGKGDDDYECYLNFNPCVVVVTKVFKYLTTYDISYDAFIISRSRMKYENPILDDRVEFTQHSINKGFVKARLLLRVNPVSENDLVEFKHTKDTKEVI